MSKRYNCEHNHEYNDLDHVKLTVHKNKLKLVFKDPIKDYKIKIKLKREQARELRESIITSLKSEGADWNLELSRERETGFMRAYCDCAGEHYIIHGKQGLALVSVHLDNSGAKEIVDDIGRFLTEGEI
ncbi:gp219 [Bacillus phage W.Ph.]|uniref:Gp219 n=1 Tax=Bacillus phage W.Ph. TaxID=764595 RepID=G9B1X0_9CAUD|nr:gp219 [Bacillus phage W.Ph.]ADH03365.1 gp219 [Bacillus phage W.Ph.]